MFGNWTTVLTTQLSEDVERVSENPAEDRGGEMGVHEDASSVILPGENYWPKTYQFKVTDKLLLCKLFFFFNCTLRANKALGDLLWGISIAGKLRSFSGDWDENISFVMKCAQCRKICHTCCWDSSVCHLPFVLAVSFLSCSVCDGSGLQTKSVPDLREQDAVPRTGFKTDFS